MAEAGLQSPFGWLTHELKEVKQLEALDAPEEEPFKCLYEGRERLETAAARLEADRNDDNADKINDAMAIINYRLGANCVACEELAKGQEKFEESIAWSETREDTLFAEHLDGLNQLGALWCTRGEHAKAEEYLRKSLHLFEEYEQQGEGVGEAEETAYTHTLFYLAQVTRHVDKYGDSAKFCQLTMKRQLTSGKYEIREWAENCVQMSGHHLSEQRYKKAAHCLVAAEAVLAKLADGAGEQTDANVAWAWGKLYMAKLQNELEILLGADRVVEADDAVGVWFDTLELRPIPADLEQEVVTYEQATTFCKSGLGWLTKAKSYYVLEGFVTEHIQILEDLGSTYYNLAKFSPEVETRCKLVKRKIDLLEPVILELNIEHFQDQIKLCSKAVADGYNELLEMKTAQVEKKEKMHSLKRLRELGEKAVKWFTVFVEAFTTKTSNPDELDDNMAVWYLTGYFGMARVHARALYEEVPQQRDALSKALANYELIVKYAEKKNIKDFDRELSMCKEMVELLPFRISRMGAVAAKK